MRNIENIEITVLCMLYDNDKLLLQDRLKNNWCGITFPGGHVNKNESFVNAVIREMKEETGLDIYNPKLCGIEQFSLDEKTRYLVLLFKTNQFSGTLISSIEGKMMWISRKDLKKYNLVRNFNDVLKIFDNDEINELFYNSNDNLFPKYY